MKKHELQIGYIVQMRDDTLSMVVPREDDVILIDENNESLQANNYDDKLKNLSAGIYDIMKVYGYSSKNETILKFSTKDRKLLWEREEPQKMTHKEIEKILGHEFEYIEEEAQHE
jgi:hypothetical protein